MKVLTQEDALKESLNAPTSQVEAPTYTKTELESLSRGVFKDHPHEAAFYADKFGTFKNQLQYDKLSDEQKEDFEKYENTGVEVLSNEERYQIELDKQSQELAELREMVKQLAAQKTTTDTPDATAGTDVTTDPVAGTEDPADAATKADAKAPKTKK